MAAHGMHQPADFQFVMAGAHPQRWEALKAGTLDAAIQLVPFNYITEEFGFPNLGDVDEYVPDFLFCAVCTRMNWANENRDHLVGLLRTLRRGVEALYDDPVAAAEVVLGEINMKPEHARRACREFVSKTVLPRDMSIDPQAFAATLEAMRRSGLIKDGPQSEVQACVDLRFLDATECVVIVQTDPTGTAATGTTATATTAGPHGQPCAPPVSAGSLSVEDVECR